MNYDAQHHLAAIFRARALQHYGAWAPNVPHTYGLSPPGAPIAPLANVGPQPFHVNHGAVSEAPGQQIVAAHPHARLIVDRGDLRQKMLYYFYYILKVTPRAGKCVFS